METQCDFIQFLIKEVKNTAFSNIEDLVSFVKRLDNKLSFLVDKRAILKHFDWPEPKLDHEIFSLKLVLEGKDNNFKNCQTSLNTKKIKLSKYFSNRLCIFLMDEVDCKGEGASEPLEGQSFEIPSPLRYTSSYNSTTTRNAVPLIPPPRATAVPPPQLPPPPPPRATTVPPPQLPLPPSPGDKTATKGAKSGTASLRRAPEFVEFYNSLIKQDTKTYSASRVSDVPSTANG
ncbi:hypothetical protein IEQ34_012364 [Dendrobium chrysotoxum]|uniref:Hydroxyproline-rich glycoprotein n=1 Tax=Dendrobium chrysotoxum TaxID=161865 RepID=A0AAV7GU00_DENCH|nr:hypothetical protein IEQ34_012364 [Dendrobium chrysotoxum]